MQSTDSKAAEVSHDDRRSSPRIVPKQAKYVLSVVTVQAQIRDESDGGMCLALPPESQVEIGETLQINHGEKVLKGRVCWTSFENQNRKRLVGLAWEAAVDS